MRDDNDSRDDGVNMGDPLWRMLNGIDRPGDRFPEPNNQKNPPSILAIICIGIVPPLILLASKYLF